MSRWLRSAADKYKEIFDTDLSIMKDDLSKYIRFEYLGENKDFNVADIFNKLDELCIDSRSPRQSIYKTMLEWLTHITPKHIISDDEHIHEGWFTADPEAAYTKLDADLALIREEAKEQLDILD